MCACTEPVRTGIGAVCVVYGRPKWPIAMLNHTHIPESHTYLVQIYVFFFFLAPYARTTRHEAFFFLENLGEKGPLRFLASLQQLQTIDLLVLCFNNRRGPLFLHCTSNAFTYRTYQSEPGGACDAYGYHLKKIVEESFWSSRLYQDTAV